MTSEWMADAMMREWANQSEPRSKERWMTVRELIEKLQALNMPDARVVTPGFDESGLDDLGEPSVEMVVFQDNVEAMGHYGRHLPANSQKIVNNSITEQPQKAVVLTF